jgi:hypothetical protein
MFDLLQFLRQRRKNSAKNHNDRMVNFLICGTQKGGTSALDAYLREHPEICMAEQKEVHFFDNEDYFRCKKPAYDRYHSAFNPKASHKLIGEATPIYMYWYSAPLRIWSYNPSMKFIILLRNPINRAYSHWTMERARNTDCVSFFDAIQSEQKRCREKLPYQHRVYSYIDRGFYLEQLRRLWFFFPKNQVLIIKSAYLKYQPNEALHDICDFLKVSHFSKVESKEIHMNTYISKISINEKAYLQSVFRHEIHGIEQVLGWDCSDWLSDD